jgi:hypothetical protein
MFCGKHLRDASTNMENPLGHGELHSSTENNYKQSTLDNLFKKM